MGVRFLNPVSILHRWAQETSKWREIVTEFFAADGKMGRRRQLVNPLFDMREAAGSKREEREERGLLSAIFPKFTSFRMGPWGEGERGRTRRRGSEIKGRYMRKWRTTQRGEAAASNKINGKRAEGKQGPCYTRGKGGGD